MRLNWPFRPFGPSGPFGLSSQLYAYAFLGDLVPLYPVYALLFAEAGLSPAEISSLFVIWSVTAFVVEVPSGAWADTYSRRRLLMLGPVLEAGCFALWTFIPSYPAFAIGFVLWGVGGSLCSGTLQALVYEAEPAGYARLIGRSEAFAATAVMAATALATPLFAVGGYAAVGLVSVAAALLRVPVAWSLPEARGASSEERLPYKAVLRAGLEQVRRSPGVRRSLALVMVVWGTTGALDEYLPMLAEATGVGTAAVPLLLLLVTAAVTVGGWCAGRGRASAAAPALVAGAMCLAAGSLTAHPAGFALVAVAFGVFHWASAAAGACLQEQLDDATRATVGSIAGFGSEVVAVLAYAGYAAGSELGAGPGLLIALAALPFVVAGMIARDRSQHRV